MSRQITKDTRGASIKKMVPSPEVNGGLSIGTLTSVDLGIAKIGEDSSYVSFRGMEVPRITFVFTEKVSDANKEPGMYFHSYTAYPDSYKDEDAWRWDAMAQTVKHFIDVFSADEFKDEYADLLLLDIKEGMEVADEVKAWEGFFKGVKTIFDGHKSKGLPKLVEKDVWMKLIMDIKGKQVNRGDFGLSSYPGDGIVELYSETAKPTIRINVAKGENIIPKEYKEPTSLDAPGGAAPTGDKMPDFMKK